MLQNELILETENKKKLRKTIRSEIWLTKIMNNSSCNKQNDWFLLYLSKDHKLFWVRFIKCFFFFLNVESKIVGHQGVGLKASFN